MSSGLCNTDPDHFLIQRWCYDLKRSSKADVASASLYPLSLSVFLSSRQLHRPPFISPDHWSSTWQGVLSVCSLMFSLCVLHGPFRWWLADYHLIKRHGQAGERRTCHSLRSSSEHRNNTCYRPQPLRVMMIPDGKWFLYLGKQGWRACTVKYELEIWEM